MDVEKLTAELGSPRCAAAGKVPLFYANANTFTPRAEWPTGVFNVFADWRVFCQTYFCLWCTQSNMFNKLDNDRAELNAGMCLLLAFASGCSRNCTELMVALTLRRQALQRLHIRETYFESTMLGTFCYPCTLCQVQRAMRMHGVSAGGVCLDDAPPPPPHGLFNRPGGHPYSTELCDCTCTECVDGYLCGHCSLAFVMSRLNSIDRLSPSMALFTSPQMEWTELCAACLCEIPITCAMRREFIMRFGVGDEDLVTSCMVATCCRLCAVNQMRRELALKGYWSGGMLLVNPPPIVNEIRQGHLFSLRTMPPHVPFPTDAEAEDEMQGEPPAQISPAPPVVMMH